MKSSVLAILFFTIFLTGCTITPKKQTVIVGSGTFYAKWQKEVLQGCSDKAALVALELVRKKSKEGYVITQEDVISLHEYLVKKCSVNSGLVI